MVSRRKVLIGLSSIFAGGGVISGSGAFSTVESNRTVNLSTVGDSSASIRIVPTTMGKNYITDDSGGGALSIDLGSQTGLNTGAKTVISPLLKVTNNSSNATRIKVTSGSIDQNGQINADGEAYDGIGYSVSNNPRAVMTFFVGPQDPPEMQKSYNPSSDSGYVNGNYVNKQGRKGVEISEGESTFISVIVDTREMISDASKDPESYSDSISVVAT